MAVSVRMDPLLERDLEVAAKRQGITKSQFIIDAVERALGRKNPYELLLKVEREFAPLRVEEERAAKRMATSTEDPTSMSARLRAKLIAEHEAATPEWEAYHGKKTAAPRKGARKAPATAPAARKRKA